MIGLKNVLRDRRVHAVPTIIDSLILATVHCETLCNNHNIILPSSNNNNNLPLYLCCTIHLRKI